MAPARVLLLDDDVHLLDLFSEALRAAGFEVTCATSLIAAGEVLRRGPVHVIVTDMRMPDVSGAAVVPAIRAMAPESHLVVYSGEVPPELRMNREAMSLAARAVPSRVR